MVGQLPEGAAARSRAVTLLYYESCNIAPTIGGEGLFGEMFRPEEGRGAAFLARMSGQLAGRLEVLAGLLDDGRDYFAGDFSIADIQLYPGLSKVVELPQPASPPALKAWVERLGARPAVQAVYAEIEAAG